MFVGMGELLLSVFLVPISLACAGLLAWFSIREVQKGTERMSKVILDSVKEVSKVVTEASSEATRAAFGAWAAANVGEVDKPVPQTPVDPQGDINAPEWMKWEDVEGDMMRTGIGDSVWVERPGYEDRAASIEEGESIIPGVPLPDMTGEKFDG